MPLPARRHKNSGKVNVGRRSPAHRAWIRGFKCSVPVCDLDAPIECAHVRTGTGGGMGMKPSDRWCISLCKVHHMLQHNMGEPEFARTYGLDLKKLAEEFARRSPHWPKLREMP